MTDQQTADCIPVTQVPGASRLYRDFCAGDGHIRKFYASLPWDGRWQQRPAVPDHWPELVRLLAEQNPGPATANTLEALRGGAGTVVTGQQVTLFGGPLFTPLKMATVVARARQATRAGRPHVPIFWLATEDHDFAEVNHVLFPARRGMERLEYTAEPNAPRPVGGLVLEESVLPLVARAQEILGASEAADALAAAYQPGKTLGQAFGEFYARIFAAQGLLILDASGRDFHRLGAPVLRPALERADEFHAALLERDAALQAAGYHVQVAVLEHSSLLFLLDEKTGARVALKRTQPSAAEPDGIWQAGNTRYATADLVGILEAEPERISPSALLRPIFQDYLLSTSLIVGGPAEIAYFGQSEVLYQKILGRQTTSEPRLSATLIEPNVAELMHRHGLTLEQVFREDEQGLSKLLAERAMPAAGRQRLETASKALDAEMDALVEWMRAQDEGLGKSAETAASKMQYQMSRLRTMAENFQLQKEASLAKHAQTIATALCPGGVRQERVHAAAYYFGRYGTELAERLCALAEKPCPGHAVLSL
ncbi:MAG: bacillithiol biosynthesis cysteine-adding enzyme BshC [Acidobacteriota bacterium]